MHIAAPAACQLNRSTLATPHAATAASSAGRYRREARRRLQRRSRNNSLMCRCTPTRYSSRVSQSGTQPARCNDGKDLQLLRQYATDKYSAQRTNFGQIRRRAHTVNVAGVNPTRLHIGARRQPLLRLLRPAVQQCIPCVQRRAPVPVQMLQKNTEGRAVSRTCCSTCPKNHRTNPAAPPSSAGCKGRCR